MQVGSKLSRSDDADDDGRGRREAKPNGVLSEATTDRCAATRTKKEDDPFRSPSLKYAKLPLEIRIALLPILHCRDDAQRNNLVTNLAEVLV